MKISRNVNIEIQIDPNNRDSCFVYCKHLGFSTPTESYRCVIFREFLENGPTVKRCQQCLDTFGTEEASFILKRCLCCSAIYEAHSLAEKYCEKCK